jgi:ribosomal protein S27AE
MQQSTDQLIASVREQKALAQRNRSIRNWVFLSALLTSGLVFAIWYVISPTTDKELKLRVIGCFAGGGLLHYLTISLQERILTPKGAACPRCGYSWEIKEGRGVHASEVMTNWDKCPGCGLLMTEALLAKSLTQ